MRFAWRKKGAYLEFLWSVFSRIRTEYREILRIRSECAKIRTRKTPNMGIFPAVFLLNISLVNANISAENFTFCTVNNNKMKNNEKPTMQ